MIDRSNGDTADNNVPERISESAIMSPTEASGDELVTSEENLLMVQRPIHGTSAVSF